MESNGVFNFEDHIKRNEGLVQKLIRWINKNVTKYFKTLSWIAVLTLLVTIIGVIIQYNTTDAGKIIENIYNETREDVEETRQLTSFVQMPDSLEFKTEVQQLRAFQNKIYAFAVSLNFLFKDPHIGNLKSMNDTDKGNYLKMVNYWIQNFQYLNKMSMNINNEGIDLCLKYNKIDSLAFSSFNIFTLYDILEPQKDLNNYQSELINKLDSRIKANDIDGALELMRDYIMDKRLINSMKSFHKAHLMYLNVVNLRLISIKNNAIEKKYGRIKGPENKPIFVPSFLKN